MLLNGQPSFENGYDDYDNDDDAAAAAAADDDDE